MSDDAVVKTILEYFHQSAKKPKEKPQTGLEGDTEFSTNTGCLKLLNNLIIHGTSRVQLDKAALAFLKKAISEVASFKIESSRPDRIEKTREIDLSAFHNLQVLEMHRVKPALIHNLRELSKTLKSYRVHDCLASLQEALDVNWTTGLPPVMPMESEKSTAWKKLTVFNASNNYLPQIDTSMMLLTQVERVDLSHNLIKKIDNLQLCYNMVFLNLEFNVISDLTDITQYVGNIKFLILRHNRIESTSGLDMLYAVENLDLGENEINSLTEVMRLASLPLLSELYLEGNPITQKTDYRRNVYSVFSAPVSVVLDGVEPTAAEKNLGKRAPNAKEDKVFVTPARVHSGSVAQREKFSSPTSPDSPTFTPTASPSVTIEPVPKKKKVKVAAISVASSVQDSGTDLSAQEFKNKMESMKKDFGDNWLVLFNESNANQPPAAASPPRPVSPQPEIIDKPTSVNTAPVSQSVSRQKNDPTMPFAVYSTSPATVKVLLNINNFVRV